MSGRMTGTLGGVASSTGFESSAVTTRWTTEVLRTWFGLVVVVVVDDIAIEMMKYGDSRECERGFF